MLVESFQTIFLRKKSALFSVPAYCTLPIFLVLKHPFFYELMVIIGVGDFRISC